MIIACDAHNHPLCVPWYSTYLSVCLISTLIIFSPLLLQLYFICSSLFSNYLIVSSNGLNSFQLHGAKFKFMCLVHPKMVRGANGALHALHALHAQAVLVIFLLVHCLSWCANYSEPKEEKHEQLWGCRFFYTFKGKKLHLNFQADALEN